MMQDIMMQDPWPSGAASAKMAASGTLLFSAAITISIQGGA
jgi:hypothetical protein